ncbi:hypothetical protein SB2_11775 [Methylobacterium radiotolerans]|nr:hypothetical protein SB3_10970 [Methylobacterium radiotolerans]KTS47972.1 hypothetical protein SB2_11775 [Methylobacterium radiotolerans]
MPTGLPVVQIHLTERGGSVKVNGVEMDFVESLTVEASRDRRSVLLRLVAGEIDVTAESAEILARYTEIAKTEP